MVKKLAKKNSKKDESDDEYDDDIDADVDTVDADDGEINEFDDEEETDEEKDDLMIEPDGTTDGCAIEDAIEDDNEYFDNDEETELPCETSLEYVSREKSTSVNRLSKYEMVRILGERTKQLTMGAKPLVKNYQAMSYDKIAEEEFKLNMIPYKIKRPLPNGKFEIWTLDELYKKHLLHLLE
jgi:DNA-directed RNA polymerase subunit K/omega